MIYGFVICNSSGPGHEPTDVYSEEDTPWEVHKL